MDDSPHTYMRRQFQFHAQKPALVSKLQHLTSLSTIISSRFYGVLSLKFPFGVQLSMSIKLIYIMSEAWL